MAERAPGAERAPAVGAGTPPTEAPARRNAARTRAWIGFWVGLLDLLFWGFVAWGPGNDGTRSIGETGEMFMMMGALVLGVSLMILAQEATGVGSE